MHLFDSVDHVYTLKFHSLCRCHTQVRLCMCINFHIVHTSAKSGPVALSVVRHNSSEPGPCVQTWRSVQQMC